MPSERDKAKRQFTLFELLAFVSALGVAIGTLRALNGVDSPLSLPPLLALCYGLASSGAFCSLGSLIGIAIAMLLVGRRGAIIGCVVGPLFLFAVLTIVFISIAGQYE